MTGIGDAAVFLQSFEACGYQMKLLPHRTEMDGTSARTGFDHLQISAGYKNGVRH